MLSFFGKRPPSSSSSSMSAAAAADALVGKIGPILLPEAGADGESLAPVPVSSLWQRSGAVIFVVRRPG
jgi:hypothetical protein